MRSFGPKLALSIALAFALAPNIPAWAGSDEDEAGPPPRAMLLFPLLDPDHGKKVFAEKGCAACHSVNGVGGDDGPPLDFDPDKGPINPFEIAADLWSHAGVMIPMQEKELGHQIELDANDIADITAFLTSPAVQHELKLSDLPPKIREHLEKEHEEKSEESYK